MYNLTVDEAHTFFVGDGQWLVHNCGAPSASDKVIHLYGFEGTVKTAEHFIDSHPLIYAGHVGISFDFGKTIYGFSPYAPGMTNREVIQALKNHVSFPGQVLNDTSVFHLAQDLADQGYRTQVYVSSMTYPSSDYAGIQQNIMNDVLNSPLSDTRYSFPGVAGCFNCATWPSVHGIPIPESTGTISRYIPALIRSGGVPWLR